MKWLVNNIHTVRNNCKRQNLITSSTTFLNNSEKKKFFHSTSSKNNNNYVKTIPKPPKTHQVTKSIVCFRHGDRSASHNLFEPDSELAVQEARQVYWDTITGEQIGCVDMKVPYVK